MNTTTRDLTIAYVQNALTEVSLLHDATLIEPTLEKFHIERHHTRFHGFAPKPGRFNPRAGLKPRPVYTVTDEKGTPLGDSIHEGDLGPRYAEAVIERQIAANLDAMLADHADLVALHSAGDGGAVPSFRYKPASSLAERTDTEATLERQKMTLRTKIGQQHQEYENARQRLNSILHRIQEAETKLAENIRETQDIHAKAAEAQQVIDRAQRVQERETRRRNLRQSLQYESAPDPEQPNGPEYG